MRNTPWVAGCCGPTLTLISMVSSSCSVGTRKSVAISGPLPQFVAAGLQPCQSHADLKVCSYERYHSPPLAALLLFGELLERLGHNQAFLFGGKPLGAR